MSTGDLIATFLAAAGCGAVVGFERQAGKHERSVTYGVRTFALYGLWGAASVMFADEFGTAAFVVSFATFGALVVAGYVADVRETGDRGTTTEIAALTVFLMGVLAWQGHVAASLALAVGTAALLRIKVPLRALTDRISEEDTRAVLQFAVITALVLPVVPNEDFGPFGAFNPHEVWLMVVLVSAIGLIGYGALRLLGERGLVLTGVLGGLVSSTAVTLGYGRMSHTMSSVAMSLSAGILGACALMYPRVLVEAALVAPGMARSLLVPMLVMLVIVAAPAAYWFWRGRRDQGDDSKLDLQNPLTLTTALQFGAIYAAIVFASEALLQEVSAESIQVVGAVSGISDVDAITLSAANLVRDGVDSVLGAKVVMLAVAVNTLVKGAIVAAVGTKEVRRAVLVGLAPAAVAGAAIWAIL